MFVDCKNCCVYFFARQPGTDALICSVSGDEVSVDHYKVESYGTPTKTTPVSADVYTWKLTELLPKVTLFLRTILVRRPDIINLFRKYL